MLPEVKTDRIYMLSLLEKKLDRKFRILLEGRDRFQFLCHESSSHRLASSASNGKTALVDMPSDKVDVVLVPVNRDELETWHRQKKEIEDVLVFPEHMYPIAFMAVTLEDDFHTIILAAQLGFDGILVRPFQVEHFEKIIDNALQRARKSFRFVQRHQKLRKLCRNVNNHRRKMRDKVDLLCQDLVKSNIELTSTLQSLQKAYDFQSEITGEFDLCYMLHKSLREIKEQVDQSHAVIYLCQTDDFEAHISAPYDDVQYDLGLVESILKQTVVPCVSRTQSVLLISEPSAYENEKIFQTLSLPDRRILNELTILTLPVIHDDQLLGVLTIYRENDMPLEECDKRAVSIYLPPLARALAAIQKLKHHILLNDE